MDKANRELITVTTVGFIVLCGISACVYRLNRNMYKEEIEYKIQVEKHNHDLYDSWLHLTGRKDIQYPEWKMLKDANLLTK